MHSHWLALGYFFLAAFLSLVATISGLRGAAIFIFAMAVVATLAGLGYLAFEHRALLAQLYDRVRGRAQRLYRNARQPPTAAKDSSPASKLGPRTER